MQDKIIKIIEQSVLAPSGENCQPWKFSITGNMVTLYNIPERDDSLYSWGQRASMIAHGALLETLQLLSSSAGLLASVQLFPEPSQQNIVARITFSEGVAQLNELTQYIPVRCTNRKPYAKKSLQSDVVQQLSDSVSNFSAVHVNINNTAESVDALARVAANGDAFVFRNQQIHTFFYNHLLWNEKENQEKSIGLYIKALEVPPGLGKMLFTLMRNWERLKKLNKIGLSKFVAFSNFMTYGRSGAVGAFLLRGQSQQEYIDLGRALQRLWLTATKLGISVQPLTAFPLLMLRVQQGDRTGLTDEEITEIQRMYKIIDEHFLPGEKFIPFMFRLGHGGEPSARATRLKPIIEVIN